MKIVDRQSKYQKILLEKVGGHTILWLDNHLQFDTRYERHYHELLADVPLLLAKQIRTVLVMGGGDGLAARQILRHRGVGVVVNVELDGEMVKLARNELRDLSEGSFFNKRVKVVVGDAYKWVRRLPKKSFDVVMADFPANTSPELSKLYSKHFYRWVHELMAPGGVFVTQVSEGDETSAWIQRALADIFGYAGRVTLVASKWTEQFVYASDQDFSQKRSMPSAPTAMEAAGKLKSGEDVVIRVN